MKNILLYLLVSFAICVAGMSVSEDVFAKKSHKSHKSEKSNKSHKSEKSNKSHRSKKSNRSRKSDKSKKSQKPVPEAVIVFCHFEGIVNFQPRYSFVDVLESAELSYGLAHPSDFPSGLDQNGNLTCLLAE